MCVEERIGISIREKGWDVLKNETVSTHVSHDILEFNVAFFESQIAYAIFVAEQCQ